MKQLSDRAILLLGGRVASEGVPNGRDQPIHRAGARTQQTGVKKDDRLGDSFRHGDGISEIMSSSRF